MASRYALNNLIAEFRLRSLARILLSASPSVASRHKNKRAEKALREKQALMFLCLKKRDMRSCHATHYTLIYILSRADIL